MLTLEEEILSSFSASMAPIPSKPAAEASASKLPPEVVRHDLFNLVIIGTLIALTIHYMVTDNGFWLLWCLTMGYFVIDCFWVIVQPTSVRGPLAIISHHILTAIYLLIPLYHPKYQQSMAFNSEPGCTALRACMQACAHAPMCDTHSALTAFAPTPRQCWSSATPGC